MASTKPMARNIDFGNSLPGFFRDDTCTAFISMPEGEEVVDDEHEAGEARPRRQQVLGGHRCSGLVALAEEDNAEEDQDDAGDQGPDDQPAAGQPRHALGAA